jgi:hypothetical protein
VNVQQTTTRDAIPSVDRGQQGQSMYRQIVDIAVRADSIRSAAIEWREMVAAAGLVPGNVCDRRRVGPSKLMQPPCGGKSAYEYTSRGTRVPS